MKLYTNYVSMIFFRSTPWRLLACLVVLITSYQVAAQDGQVKCELLYTIGHNCGSYDSCIFMTMQHRHLATNSTLDSCTAFHL